MKTTKELIEALDLKEARARLEAAVRAEPADAAVRLELADLLVVLQDWEKADRQYDMVSTLDPTFAPVVALVRQLIRAEAFRREVFEDGRAPEVLGEVDETLTEGLRRLMELRDPAVEAVAPPPDVEEEAGLWSLGDQRFSSLRDLDDRTAFVLEVLTSTGVYYWVPWSRVQKLEIQAPERLRDLVWRAADLSVEDGPEGRVYLPLIYQGAAANADPALLIGRASDWVEKKGLVCGAGLKMLLCGEEAVALGDGGAQSFERIPA